MAKLIVELPDEMHRELKRAAALQGRTLKEVVSTLVDRFLSEEAIVPSAKGSGLCGKWADPRSAKEIVAFLKAQRR